MGKSLVSCFFDSSAVVSVLVLLASAFYALNA